MPMTKEQVLGNAQAFIDTLERLTAKQRQEPPSRQYREELNKLIGLAKEVGPRIDERLWPQPVKLVTSLAGFADIETAARQIVKLLS